MKIFNTELTDRGSIRKNVYCKHEHNNRELIKLAKALAIKDFKAEKRRENINTELITPYKHKDNKIEYWLRFERATYFRYFLQLN